jgi:hypothetical protein
MTKEKWIKCVCGKILETNVSFGLHGRKCSLYQRYLTKVLTREFLQQRIHLTSQRISEEFNDLYISPADVNRQIIMFKLLHCRCGKRFSTEKGLISHRKRCKIFQTYLSSVLTNEVVKNKTFEDIKQEYPEFYDREIEQQLIKPFVCMCGRGFDTRRSFSNHAVHCKPWLKYKEGVLSKEFYDEYYRKQKLPFPVIVSDVLNNEFSYGIVVKEASKFGYKPMTASQAMKNKVVQRKQRNSIRKKYGVDNVSQSQEIKDKKVDTMMKKFGVSHHLKLASQIEKRDKTCFEKYGVTNVSKVQKVKNKKKQTFLEHYDVDNIFKNQLHLKIMNERGNKPFSRTSKLASLFFDRVDKLIKPCEELKTYFSFDNVINEYWVYVEKPSFSMLLDFAAFYEDRKVAIEFNGDYWHMNPEVYDLDMPHPHLDRKEAKDIWYIDNSKLSRLRGLGFETLIVWERDVIKNRDLVLSQTVDFIRNALDLPKSKLRRRTSL